MLSTLYWLLNLVAAAPVAVQDKDKDKKDAEKAAQDKDKDKDKDKKDQDEAPKKEIDPEAIWQALDEGSAEKLAAAGGADTAKILEVIKKGRKVREALAGEVKDKIKDGFGVETDLLIIVPAKYEPAKPAGVIVLLHGLGANGAQLKDMMSGFASMHNYIIAAPTAQKEPESAKNEDGSGGPAGAKEPAQGWSYREGSFPLAAISLLKKRYAIDENRVLLAGYSMGGFAAWNIGLRYPDRFSALVSFAGGFAKTEFKGLRVDDALRKLHLNSFNLPIYFVHGDADKTVPVEFDRESRNQLKKLGYDYEYREIPKGAHTLNLKETGDVVAGAEKWLKDRVRKPHPKEVKHFSLGEYCAQSYWVKIAEFKEKTAEVRASIKDQTIDFTATGAKKLTFYIDETLLDPTKPIKVTSGGSKTFEGEVKLEVPVLVESWKSREDRDLLYRAKVTVEVR